MADTIKIGNLDISAFKVGSDNCKIYLGDTLLYPQSQPTIKNYLRFIAKSSCTFTFTGNDIDYSLDSGATWTTLSNGNATPTITAGSSILWKASGLTPTSSIGIGRFSSTANFVAEGNVMSLLYGDNFEGQTSLSGKDYALRNLFDGCTSLISIENLVLPATTLTKYCYDSMFYGCTSLTTVPELPATTLAENCYSSMFTNCISLKEIPNGFLPATTLANNCYRGMFQQCTSLKTLPSGLLPARTLANTCYLGMFYGCTSLTTVPELPATTLVYRCYYNMFNRCTSLTTAPELPATTLATGCYYSMFYQCSSLTTSPVLPAPTLVQDCYRQMFYNCRNLNKITCLATTGINTNNSTSNWLSNTSSSGTFYRAAGVSWPTGNSGIPRNWTVVDYNPYEFKHLTFTAKSSGTFTFTPKTDEASGNVISYSLDSGSTWTSANTTSTVQSGDVVYVKGENFGIRSTGGGIGTFSSTCNFDVEGNVMSLLYGDNFENQTSLSGKNYAFMNLFSGCTTVINAENLVLPATTLSNYCYCNMFNRAINLVKAPSELPATTLGDACYMNMFYSGTSLTTAPELHAETLVQDCYRQMFQYCTNLNKITCLATNISASNCTNNWVANVVSNGTFYKASGMSSWTTGNSGIPSGWTVVDYSG